MFQPIALKTGLRSALYGLLACLAAVFAPAGPSIAQDQEIMPALTYAPATRVQPLFGNATTELLLDARMTPEGEPITSGMVWRVFGTRAGVDGELPLVATARGGAARFELEPGSYLVHAGFGRAGASARVELSGDPQLKSMVLNAGGLKLDAMLPDGSEVRRAKLNFNIFKTGADGDRELILPNVPPGKTVRLQAGTYHIVSDYGAINATIRADLVVEAGRLTEASIEHRAALVTLNLVRSEDGYPLADTAWSVVGISGEVIAEDVGAYPEMILAAGEYTVVAKHRDQIYQRDITVEPGEDVTVRVMVDGSQPVPAQ